MVWFWYFVMYSFLGFLLEVAYAKVTRAKKQDRKCFVLLPLCPVYGLGAMAILAVTAELQEHPVRLAMVGGAAAVAVEYGMGLFYRRMLGVSFWDYSHLPMNLGGYVCLPFALAWGLLALALVYGVHPRVMRLAGAVPGALFPLALVFLLVDGAVSTRLLKEVGRTEILRWYDHGASLEKG